MTFEYDKVLCPECNSEMKSRTGKYGVFWGCVNYPNCTGTRDSQGRSRQDREAEKPGYTSENNDIPNQTGSHPKTTFNRKK